MSSPLPPFEELDRVTQRVEVAYPSGALALVTLVGEQDVSLHKALGDALNLAAARRRHVIVDLSDCAFIDSTVVMLLIAARDAVTAGQGQFALVIPTGATRIARVSEVMGLVDVFTIYSNREDAAASVTHVTRVRDLRARFGDPEGYVAECSCGWKGEQRTGPLAMRSARRDGVEHADARVARPRSGAGR